MTRNRAGKFAPNPSKKPKAPDKHTTIRLGPGATDWLEQLREASGESASDLAWEGLRLVAESRGLTLPAQPGRRD